MTTLNINYDKKKKEKLNDIIKKSNYKTLSDFVRNAIDEKMIIEEKYQSKKEEIEIPEYIPDGKYVAIARNTIVGVGDSPSELVMEISSKFINDSIRIKRKGKKHQSLEYIFMAESIQKCWEYFELEEKTYPLLPFTIETGDKVISGRALPDTAASLTLIDEKIVSKLKLEEKRIEEIFTVDGIKKLQVYELEINLVEFKKKIEVVKTAISDKFPFQILIGRNLIDFLDLYFFGEKQIVCFKPS